ncbi:plasma membrane ATPase, partial [Phakopsora pachyrhizi]
SVKESLCSSQASFIQRASVRTELGGKVHANYQELCRIPSAQAVSAGSALSQR